MRQSRKSTSFTAAAQRYETATNIWFGWLGEGRTETRNGLRKELLWRKKKTVALFSWPSLIMR